ncbi:MAG: cobyrinate a,c-diamide synthase [Cocleimonas sp.]|nr:cobyrinate a,c-diamide synthase [Cocleimonas sp.]
MVSFQPTTASCPAIFISAPASGQGKTTITAGLARYHHNQGRKVRVFKTGPDYLDPLILQRASHHPVEQIDLWMMGEDYCRQVLYQAACEADLIIIEGAMGLYDGDPSSADLAEFFGIPIVLVINGQAMAQTFGAITLGLTHYRQALTFAGVIANNVASERHKSLIKQSIPNDVTLLGYFPRNQQMELPHRHLGLIDPNEIEDFEQRLEMLANEVSLSDISKQPLTIAFKNVLNQAPQPKLTACNIAIAKDEAFSFIYAENIRLLEALGATIQYFSPLHDQALPIADALWLPGGYPELHKEKLQNNHPMHQAIQQHYQAGKKILAECGGMLYIQKTLTGIDDKTVNMVGLISGDGHMRTRSGCQGMQTALLPEGEIRAHAHHHSRSENTIDPISHARRATHPAPGEAIYRSKGLTASYLHLFFPSNEAVITKLFLK